MPYAPGLSDALSRLRFAVGDIDNDSPFAPDGTYRAALRETTIRRVLVTITAADDTLSATGHGFSDRDPVMLSGLVGGAPLTQATIYYVRDAEEDTLKLTSTLGGTALDLTADGSAIIGVLDEGAATRMIAAGLAAQYASKPTDITLPSGLRTSWRERINHWRAIARGEAGGPAARMARGMTLRRGPAVDYSTGEGDE